MTDQYLFVTFKVTGEGEQGHPMDHILKRVEIDPSGEVDGASLAEIVETIRREIRRTARRASSGHP